MLALGLDSVIGISLLLSALTYVLTPRAGRLLKSRGIVGIDIHKSAKPRVPEMGGVVIAASALVMLGFFYLMSGLPQVLYLIASTTMFALYGIADDRLHLGKYPKLAISLAFGTAAVLLASPALLLIPVLVVLTIGLGNVFNIFAGFNGLESGSSAIVAFFFSLLCLMTGNVVPFYISLSMSIILLGFLLHNKYPASIFPGNVGTMAMGGFFAGMCLYFGLFHLLMPLLSIHIADMALKGASAGFFSSSEKGRTRVKRDGVLVPRSDYLSLCKLLLRMRPMKEKQLVNTLWLAEAAVCFAVVIITGVLI